MLSQQKGNKFHLAFHPRGMSHDTNKKMLDREAVRSVIQQWNANRLDLFALSEPDEVWY